MQASTEDCFIVQLDGKQEYLKTYSRASLYCIYSKLKAECVYIDACFIRKSTDAQG